jgi:glyoxylase-like metal-dependent hydrolase (beta-lactamase superfamily II)
MAAGNGINRKNYLSQHGITSIMVPMPLVVPHANAFFIDGDTPVLIDTGFSSPGSIDVIKKRIREAGRDIKDIGLVLLTHGHRDHFGMADEIRDISGAKILLNKADAGLLNKDAFANYLDRVTELYRDVGVSDEKFQFHINFNHHESRIQGLKDFIPDDWIAEGDKFVTGAGEITVFETPGHTEGSISLFLENSRVLFTGDLISAVYDPPPLVMVERDGGGWLNIYDTYMNSLSRLEEIDPVILAPGHGAPIKKWGSLVKRVFSSHEALTEKIEIVLKECSEMKLGILAERIYPNALGPLVTLSINVIMGILNRMEREGRVAVSEEYFVQLVD